MCECRVGVVGVVLLVFVGDCCVVILLKRPIATMHCLFIVEVYSGRFSALRTLQ